MTPLLTTAVSNDHVWLCPMTFNHGVLELPEIIGSFSRNEGHDIEITQAPTGPSSYTYDLSDEHNQRNQIRDIVQNHFSTTATSLSCFDEPVILANGAILVSQYVEAVVDITLRSLSEHPDFVAHISILRALYEFVGMRSDVEDLCKIAATMTVEEGMWLPVMDLCKNTCVMKIGSSIGKPGCHNVTFYGSNEGALPFRTGHAVGRIARWKERGSTELHCTEAVIGEIV